MSDRLFTRGYDQSYGELATSASVFVSGSKPVVLTNGGIHNASNTNTFTFVGVAVEDTDNLDGGTGAKKTRFVKAPAEVSLRCSGSAAEFAVYGRDMYTNAAGVCVVSGSGVGVKVGKLQEAEGDRAGFYWIKLSE